MNPVQYTVAHCRRRPVWQGCGNGTSFSTPRSDDCMRSRATLCSEFQLRRAIAGRGGKEAGGQRKGLADRLRAVERASVGPGVGERRVAKSELRHDERALVPRALVVERHAAELASNAIND